jgi:hypothetical protein
VTKYANNEMRINESPTASDTKETQCVFGNSSANRHLAGWLACHLALVYTTHTENVPQKTDKLVVADFAYVTIANYLHRLTSTEIKAALVSLCGTGSDNYDENQLMIFIMPLPGTVLVAASTFCDEDSELNNLHSPVLCD